MVVSPGADPERIRFAVEGAEAIRMDADGNLILKTSQGEVMQQKPKIYQREGARLAKVEGDYVITGKNEIGFRLGSYDRRAAVVIDPVLRYSTFLGGNNVDEARGIGMDSSKRAVVGGSRARSTSHGPWVPRRLRAARYLSPSLTSPDRTWCSPLSSGSLRLMCLTLAEWPWIQVGIPTRPEKLNIWFSHHAGGLPDHASWRLQTVCR